MCLRARASFDNNVALIQLQFDQPVDGPLACGNRAGDKLPFWREEVAVVQDPAEFDRGELVP